MCSSKRFLYAHLIDVSKLHIQILHHYIVRFIQLYLNCRLTRTYAYIYIYMCVCVCVCVCVWCCSATAMQAPRGERVELLLILDLGTRWEWVISVTTRPRFTAREGSPIPIRQEAGWASELVWTQSLEEKSFASTEDRTPIVQSVVRLTELLQLTVCSNIRVSLAQLLQPTHNEINICCEVNWLHNEISKLRQVCY
jgi:hypothetical protein